MMVKSGKFMVNSDAERMAAARYATEDFARQANLGRHDTLRLDLLVEETLGMAKTMLEEFYGQIWFTADGRDCEIHFEATAEMDADKKEGLLSVSSTGKNAAAKGFMAKLGEVISGALHSAGRSIDIYGQETMKYGVVNMPELMMGNAEMMTVWSLQTYRVGLNQARATDEEVEEAWDELEKSIVARLADDVVVGVRGDRIDLVIKKQF